MTISTEDTWGSWSLIREVPRGLLHYSIGFIGWMLVHPLGWSAEMVLTVIIWMGGLFLSLDVFRVVVARCGNYSRFVMALKRMNSGFMHRYLVRDVEKHSLSTSTKSVVGLLVAWFAPAWIGALASLLFGTVDPIAKFGKRYPIKRFRNGKSWGGLLYGLLAGIAKACFVVVMDRYYPILPAIPLWHIALVYATGAVSASLMELYGGKWDNFWIPAGSAGSMWLADLLLSC